MPYSINTDILDVGLGNKAQNIPLLDVEGVSKLNGTMYHSDSLDVTTIDIRNNFDPDRSYPIDSAAYYIELFRSNTLIGGYSDSQSLLQRSSTFGGEAGFGQTGTENKSVGIASSIESALEIAISRKILP